jgi:hypothetical protein
MKVRGFSGGDVTTGGTLTLPALLQRERLATRKTDVLRVQRGIDKFENNGFNRAGKRWTQGRFGS